MPASRRTLDQAVDLTRTGDIWLFRGRTVADRAIQTATNSPVNHVGMALTIEDLPPLMWHAELGRSLQDMWSGQFRRGVQLHDLRGAVTVWGNRYGQRPWLRQLSVPLQPHDPSGAAVQRELEDAALRTVARLAGTPFPSTVHLAGRWVRGRTARLPQAARALGRPWRRAHPAGTQAPAEPVERGEMREAARGSRQEALETAYCAEVVAATYQAMGLLPAGRAASWYDPGRFWSGDDLRLLSGARLGPEIAVELPPAPAPVRSGPAAGAGATPPARPAAGA